ncbi:hypothetical protein ABH941_003567 [Streptacidiphilus sp. EB103A]
MSRKSGLSSGTGAPEACVFPAVRPAAKALARFGVTTRSGDQLHLGAESQGS